MKSPSSEMIVKAAERASQREKDLWKLASQQPDRVPSGFRTTNEWASVWGKSRPSAQRIISTLCDMGKMEMRAFKKSDVSGRGLPIPHYRAL